MTHDGHATSEDRARLLFLTRNLELPPLGGAAIRAHRLLVGLAREFAVTLLTFEHDRRSVHPGTRRDALVEGLPGIEVVTVPGLGPGKRADQAARLLSPRSYEWGRYRRPALRRALEELVAARRPALVHFDDPGVGLCGPAAGPLNAFAPHNVEHRILAATAADGRGARRRYAALEARKVGREERALWRRMGLCVAVSELDAAAMRAGGARRVVVCPNGTDPVPPLPPPRRADGEPLRLLFVGTGSYWPNEQGLRWFVGEVLPRLRGRLDTEFDVVGVPPRRPMAAPGVRYLGVVPDLRPSYERAHAVVVPLFHGSGTRLKVVEAMAHRRPVVSTALGAEGLPVRAGEHFLRAEDPDAFAGALVALADRLAPADDGITTMLDAAGAAAAELFWPAVAGRLAEAYRRELA